MERHTVALLALLLALVAVPGIAAAETRAGGAVTVGAYETVDGDLEAFAGSVVVRGTVTGDLTAVSGDVLITGTVEGDVQAAAGSVEIRGTVGGDVEVAAGTVSVGPNATIDGSLQAGAERVTIDGTIAEDAEIGAQRTILGPSASIGGDLTYGGRLAQADGATVDGEIERAPGQVTVSVGPDLPSPLVSVYGLLVTALAASILLVVFPRFSDDVALRGREHPLRSAAIGLAAAVAAIAAFVVLLITIIGIPLALVLAVLAAIVVWIGAIYARYVIGAWLVGLTGVSNRWVALLVGLLVVAALGLVPIVGGLIRAVIVLLGFGALASALWGRYERPSAEEIVR